MLTLAMFWNPIPSKFKLCTDEAVILTSEMYDPCTQESPTHKKKTRTPYKRHQCRAGQIPSKG